MTNRSDADERTGTADGGLVAGRAVGPGSRDPCCHGVPRRRPGLQAEKAGQPRLPGLQHRGGPHGGLRPRGRAEPPVRARRVPGRGRAPRPGRRGLRSPGGDAPHASIPAAVHAGPLARAGGPATAPGGADPRRPARQGGPQPADRRAGQPRRAAPPLDRQHRADPDDTSAPGAARAARPSRHLRDGTAGLAVRSRAGAAVRCADPPGPHRRRAR